MRKDVDTTKMETTICPELCMLKLMYNKRLPPRNLLSVLSTGLF